MKTKVVSAKGKEVLIGDGGPTVLIGERINPFGKSGIKEALLAGNMEPIALEATRQVEAGADILIVSVAAFGIDESVILPQVVEVVSRVVDVPLCLESRNPAALRNALGRGCGTPIVSSVTGEEQVLAQLLPLIKEHGTPFIALATDSAGIPAQAEKRLAVMRAIVTVAERAGIDRSLILADCLAESIGINAKAAETTVKSMAMVKQDMGLNLVLGASNISFGLPMRSVINAAFLALTIGHGLDSAIVNVGAVRPYVLASDLLTGKDPWARRYAGHCRLAKNKAPK